MRARAIGAGWRIVTERSDQAARAERPPAALRARRGLRSAPGELHSGPRMASGGPLGTDGGTDDPRIRRGGLPGPMAARWQPLADAGRGDGGPDERQPAAIARSRLARSRLAGTGQLAPGRHAHARRGRGISSRCPGLHDRHLAPLGYHRTQPGHRDRGVRATGQRVAARPARGRRELAPAADPVRPAAARVLRPVRRRRPEPSGSRAADARFLRRDRPRIAHHLCPERPVGFHAQRHRQGRVGDVLPAVNGTPRTAAGDCPQAAPETIRGRRSPRPKASIIHQAFTSLLPHCRSAPWPIGKPRW
jgi:hypothetical protein